MTEETAQTGIYFHWPFCLSKCPYCDFNVHVRESVDHDVWEVAYLKAIEGYAERLGPRLIGSVFFGGGTPSLMKPQTAENILDAVHRAFPCANDLEVTMEANPTSVENEKLKAFRAAGINRMSLGVQALNDDDLKFLGRKHSLKEALEAIEITGTIFDHSSFDLIYARPQQSLKDWRQELEFALKLSHGHLSLYQLTIERSTPFYFAHRQKKFSMPGEDLSADFYLLTQEVMGGAGMPAYEVSNHASEGHQSKHNRIYWEYQDYIGIGPGAHGRLTIDGIKYATRDHYAPEPWLEKVDQTGMGAHPFESLTADDKFMEAIMMGLRLSEGVSLAHLEQLGGKAWLEFMNKAHLKAAREAGWLDYNSDRIWLSIEGKLRLNALIPYITATAEPSQPQAVG